MALTDCANFTRANFTKQMRLHDSLSFGGSACKRETPELQGRSTSAYGQALFLRQTAYPLSHLICTVETKHPLKTKADCED